jgi:hypothetical protein
MAPTALPLLKVTVVPVGPHALHWAPPVPHMEAVWLATHTLPLQQLPGQENQSHTHAPEVQR